MRSASSCALACAGGPLSSFDDETSAQIVVPAQATDEGVALVSGKAQDQFRLAPAGRVSAAGRRRRSVFQVVAAMGERRA